MGRLEGKRPHMLPTPPVQAQEYCSWLGYSTSGENLSVPGPEPQSQGGSSGSSPSGHGVLRTVHLRVSLVSEQVVWSPAGANSTLRVRSSEPRRKPQSFFFLEHGPHGDHSLISHCAGGKRRDGKEEGQGVRSPSQPTVPQGRQDLEEKAAKGLCLHSTPGHAPLAPSHSHPSAPVPAAAHQDCCTPGCHWKLWSPRDRLSSSGPCAGTSPPDIWCRSYG